MRFRRSSFIFGTMLALSLPVSGEARQRALVLLGQPEQSVNLLYDYTGKHASYVGRSSSASSDHNIEETYHFEIPYAIYTPRLLRGKAGFDLGFNQEMFSSDSRSAGSSGIDLQYAINGVLLDKKPFPVTFYSRSTRSHFQQEFAGSYDLQTDSNGVGVSIKNAFLPAHFLYNTTSSETSGQFEDRVQESENIALTVSHVVEGLSSTEMEVSRADDRSALTNGLQQVSNRLTNYRFTNHLSRRGVSLNSTYRFRESAGLFQERSSEWMENLTAELGKGLDVGLDYSNTRFRNPSYRENANNGAAWLQHRLFKSLITRCNFQIGRAEFSSGQERTIGGMFGFNYHKNLPASGALELSFSQRVDAVDRNLSEDRITVIDEGVTAHLNADPDQNLLANPYVAQESVVVRSAVNLAVVYRSGIDYFLEQAGTRTRLVFPITTSVREGASLLVNYDYLVNPSVGYISRSRSFAAEFSLMGGMYRLYGTLDETHQDLTSGRADNIRLISTRTYKVGAAVKRKNGSCGLEYRDYSSVDDSYYAIEGNASYHEEVGGGTLLLHLRDTYTRHSVNSYSSLNGQGYGENLLKLGGRYARTLWGRADLGLTGDYANNRGYSFTREVYAFALSLRVTFRNIFITIQSNVNWQNLGGSSLRDEQVRFELTRYF